MAQDPKKPKSVPAPMPEPRSQVDAQVRAMLDKNSSKRAVFVGPDGQGPSPELLAGSGRTVFQLPFSGANGGARGTLYTVDRDIYLDAASRESSKRGITDKDLDRYLYGREQGKPGNSGVVVQRRDDKGSVVVSRLTDPKDVKGVAKELSRQVRSGQTTVVSPQQELEERAAGLASDVGSVEPLGGPIEPSYLQYAAQFTGEIADEELDYLQYTRNLLGEDVFAPRAPQPPPAPPAGQKYMGVGKSGAPIFGVPGTLSTGVRPEDLLKGETQLDKWVAAGENFVSSYYRSIDSLIKAPGRFAVDFSLNRDIPFAQWDDELRARVAEEAARTGIDPDLIQQSIWEKLEPPFETALGIGPALNLGERMQRRFSRRPKAVQETIRANIAGGVGSFVPSLPLAFVSGGAALAGGAVMAGTQNGYEAYSQSREQGASFEDSLTGAGIAAAPGALSAVSARFMVAPKMFARWDGASGGRVAKMMDTLGRYAATRIGSAGAVEAISEAADELFIKAGIAYATDQDLLELENFASDLAKSAEAGGETGAFIRAVLEAIVKGRASGQKGLSPTVEGKPLLDEETGEPIAVAPTALTPAQAESVGRGAAVPFGPRQEQNVVDRYVSQAMNQPELLPRETPVNELAAIIAAEEKIDIGIATAAARAVRERLDQQGRDPNRAPQLSDYTKIDPRDPRTWPEGVDDATAQREYSESFQRFVADYKDFEARQKAGEAQQARQRQVMGGRAVTEQERKSLASDIRKKYAEIAKQGERDVGEAQRTYLREIYIEQLIEANKADLLDGKPTEAEYQRRVRELIRKDNRRPEMRDTPEAQQDAEFWKQKLLESYRQREDADAAELAQREADYQIELDRIAAEVQARQDEFLAGVARLTEAESEPRKKEMKELADHLKLLQREAVRKRKSIQSLVRQRQEAEARLQAQQEEAQARFGPEAETPERKAKLAELREYFSQLERDYERLSKGYSELARQRKISVEQAETAQKELNDLFTGGMETPERKAELDKMKADFRKKYGDIEEVQARTEEEEAAYAQFEAELPAMRQELEEASAAAAEARQNVEIATWVITNFDKEISAAIGSKDVALVKELRQRRAEAEAELGRQQKEVLGAERRVREARDRMQKEPNAAAKRRSAEVDPSKSVTPTAASVTVAPQYAPRVATFFSGTGTVEAMLGRVSHVLAVENEDAVVDAYNAAHGTKFASRNVFDVNVDEVKAVNPDLFHASPVCKEFSLANLGKQAPDQDEIRSAQQVAKVIREVQPPAVTIENVPAYAQFGPFKDIESALKEAGYKYRILVVDAADYGAAQTRKRLIVQAVRTGELPPLPEKTGPADWFELTKDLLATAEESKIGPDELARIQSMIKAGKLDATKPIITMGGSAIKGVANAANAGGPAPVVNASERQVVRVLYPDGRSVRVPMRALARLQGLPDSFTIPSSTPIAKKVLGNGVHGVITEKFIRPLLPKAAQQDGQPVAPVTAQGENAPVPAARNKFQLTDAEAGAALARAMPDLYGAAQPPRQTALRRVLQIVSEPGNQTVTIDDILNIIPAKKGEKLQDRRIRVQEYLAALTDAGMIQPVDGAGKRTYHLTLEAAERFRKDKTPVEAPPQQGQLFGRPGEKPAAPKLERIGAEAVTGQPAPGKTPYEYRIEAALRASFNAMDLDFVAPESRLEVGAAAQQTINNIERATDEQLLQMLGSSQPLGLQAVADVTEVDRFGQPIVKSTKVEVRALDKKTTTAIQWMAQRVLASGELRRRAALAALRSDVKRSEMARGAPTTPGGKFGRPRTSYDATTGKEAAPDMRRGQPIIDLQDSPGAEGFGLTGTIDDTRDAHAGEPVNKLQLRDAVRAIADIVYTPLITANMSGKPYVGQYDPRRNLIQVQSSFNFLVNLHEVGHGMVAMLFGMNEAGPRNLDSAVPPAVRAELERLGRSFYGNVVPEGGYLHEGFAEFTAGYVMRPERYNARFPATSAWYQELLNQNPDLAQAMGQAQDVFNSYRFQGSEARLLAGKVDPNNPAGKNAVARMYERLRNKFWVDTIEREFFNSMSKLRVMQNDAIKQAKELAKRGGSSLVDLSLLRVADYGEAILAKQQQLLQTWMTTAMTDGSGNIRAGSKSMYHVLAPLRAAAQRLGTDRHMQDFESYLAAKRELALLESGRISASTNGIVDMREGIARLEARYGDAIKQTYADYMQWWQGAIQYVRDNDPFLRRVFDSIERVERETGTAGTYVPLQRVVHDLATGQRDVASLADAFDLSVVEDSERMTLGSRVTKGELRGSTAPRTDVLKTAESSLQALLSMTHKRMLTRNVVNLGAVLNMRGYAIEIPIDDTIDLSAMTAQGNDAMNLLKAGDQEMIAGMRVVGQGSAVNADGRIIVDFVDVVEVPGQFELDADGNQVPAMKVVRKRISLDENVVRAVAAIDPHEAGRAWRSMAVLKQLDTLTRAATGSFKTFATGVNVGFQLISAPIMDFGTTFLNGTQPWCGLRLPVDYLYTMGRLAMAEVAPVALRFDAFEQYKQIAGGFDSGWGVSGRGATIESLGRTRKQKAIDIAKSVVTPWNGEIYQLLERKLSFASRTGRLLEMKQALKQAGYPGSGPISQEQANAAITAMRRVTTNWSLSGRTAGELNKLIPYFNVTFVTFRDYARSASKQMKDPRTRIQYTVKTAAVMGAAAAYWAMVHDDEDEAMKEAYANASYEDRMRFWIFGFKSDEGTTEVVRIPNPMTEFLPAKLVQASLDGIYSNDPYVTGNWMKAMITSFMPSLLPSPLQAGLESLGNVNDLNKAMVDAGFEVARIPSTKSATPLESTFGKGPAQERVTPYTSKAAEEISQYLNGALSPRQADQMLESVLAGGVDQLSSLLRIEGSATPAAVKQAPGYGSYVGEQVVGRLVSKTGPYSMRSPKVQELATLLEAAQKRKDSTQIPETPQMAAELMALKDAWGCVSVLHFLANNYPDKDRAQRQNLQKLAYEIASDVTAKAQRGALAADYKRWDPMSKALKQERERFENTLLAQKPGFYPSIDWSKLLR